MPKYKYVDGEKYRVVPQSVLGYALVKEGSDNSLPSGGTEGQVLTKASNADFDVEWASVEGAVVIDVTPVLDPPAGIPGDYDIYLTANESIAEITALVSESPVVLRFVMSEGGGADVAYIPLSYSVNVPGAFSLLSGGAEYVMRGNTVIVTVDGFDYNSTTYFGYKQIPVNTGIDPLHRAFTIRANLYMSGSDIAISLEEPDNVEYFNTAIFNSDTPVVELYVPSTIGSQSDHLEYCYAQERDPGSEVVKFEKNITYNYRTGTIQILPPS